MSAMQIPFLICISKGFNCFIDHMCYLESLLCLQKIKWSAKSARFTGLYKLVFIVINYSIFLCIKSCYLFLLTDNLSRQNVWILLLLELLELFLQLVFTLSNFQVSSVLINKTIKSFISLRYSEYKGVTRNI